MQYTIREKLFSLILEMAKKRDPAKEEIPLTVILSDLIS